MRSGLFSRRTLVQAGLAAVPMLATRAWAKGAVDLMLPGGPSDRPTTTAFPGKGPMILQRTRPPLLETPMEVFNKGVFTPNDRFFVRWHWAVIPESVDVRSFRLTIHGAVNRTLSVSLDDLLKMPRTQLAAVNQCSGNSRGLFVPRVPGAQWRHGAMGNALWTGVSLRHVLDLAGVKPNAVAVRFGALDEPVVPDAPDFSKSLSIDHARDAEVMIAFAMNNEQLPLLNGFPLRLIVPGWYSTYWVKALNEIEVLDKPDDGYWMTKAYKVPDTPFANVAVDAKDVPTVPISRMVPRSFITNVADGAKIPFSPNLNISGIAFGGDCGVASVDISTDNGRNWNRTNLGADQGKFGFRRFETSLPIRDRGKLALLVRCSNTAGIVQPMEPNWNPGGFMRGCVEPTHVVMT